ncbi:hypothetical protein RHSIM_Rhsim10G0114100 [Rhododendron simsii]|uniref:Uncharacterized protein n=1 Tax=Rhododendron simsii TaxID=118357 RepID=A0A834GAU3_RHOSS|nr:hypothetical protein RHSIM_Rhsim10G0114100 [Rhododendron simsii]
MAVPRRHPYDMWRETSTGGAASACLGGTILGAKQDGRCEFELDDPVGGNKLRDLEAEDGNGSDVPVKDIAEQGVADEEASEFEAQEWEIGDIGSFSQQFSARRELTMSMVKDALFNEEARRKEMGTMSYSGMQALVGDGRAGLRKESAGVPTVHYWLLQARRSGGGATVRHWTTGTGKKQGKQGARRSQQCTWNRCSRNQRAQGDSPARTEATEGVLGLLEVYTKAQSTETRLKLYNASDHGTDQETSPICSRFDQGSIHVWKDAFRFRGGGVTVRKAMIFERHPEWGCGHPMAKGLGHRGHSGSGGVRLMVFWISPVHGFVSQGGDL